MMNTKYLELQDEGSWALMIEESNIRAIQKYHGCMADLNIDYYLSVGMNRWYKAYFDRENILLNRIKMNNFLLDNEKYNQCISEIFNILEKMSNVKVQYENLNMIEKFDLYCSLLCEYIAYYNSVIADTFYQNIYELVDSKIPKELKFVANQIKDSLFATNNNNLLSHTQTVELLDITEKYFNNKEVNTDIERYVKKYKSTTTSSGNPNGVTKEEINRYIVEQCVEDIELQKTFLNNLNFRYCNSEKWGEMTADTLKLSNEIKILIRRTSQLSYIKILMREKFQKFKIDTREAFLSTLINKIGKEQFDYMRIDEICDYICKKKRISQQVINERRAGIIFELNNNVISCPKEVPVYVSIEDEVKKDRLTGDVLIGSGLKRYRVRRIEQNEEGLSSFNEYIETTEDKDRVALITNVLRPFLVPKLKKFGVLLTQYGGYTSHAAVLCRELGINSIISVNGLMNSLDTDDVIEVDFDNGTIKKVNSIDYERKTCYGIAIDLNSTIESDEQEIGNKALNLVKINRIAQIPKGFVLTKYAIENLDKKKIQDEIMDKIVELNCSKLAIRSSHEGEDGENSSCAGLFESFVNVDAIDKHKVIECVKKVYDSKNSNCIGQYKNIQEGDMHVIIQEMISADVSGVVLTSTPYNGLDYMLIEYIKGDLCYLMQGDITPFISYINKIDILGGNLNYSAYPAVITEDIKKIFFILAQTAIKLENLYAHRVEIEWGIKDDMVYIFQVRPY